MPGQTERTLIIICGFAITFGGIAFCIWWEDRKERRRKTRIRIDVARCCNPTGWEEMDAINSRIIDAYRWREIYEGES